MPLSAGNKASQTLLWLAEWTSGQNQIPRMLGQWGFTFLAIHPVLRLRWFPQVSIWYHPNGKANPHWEIGWLGNGQQSQLFSVIVQWINGNCPRNGWQSPERIGAGSLCRDSIQGLAVSIPISPNQFLCIFPYIMQLSINKINQSNQSINQAINLYCHQCNPIESSLI